MTSWSRRELAKTAAEFHFVGLVNWILKDARPGTRERVREFAVEHRLIDVILGMADPPPVEERTPLFAESMAAYEDELLEWLPEAADKTRLIAAHDGRDIASLIAFCDAADSRRRS
jgi:hypothetical protein